ncbi:hypothetical protein ACLOJK_019611 [Asimina triloba]
MVEAPPSANDVEESEPSTSQQPKHDKSQPKKEKMFKMSQLYYKTKKKKDNI